jgi:hypothetical protein
MSTRFNASPSSWSSGQGLGHIDDNPPPNPLAFREAAAELARIAKECHRVALKTGDKGLISEGKAGLETVAGLWY